MTIINLTQHAATPEQTGEGVQDLHADARTALVAALTFDALPEPGEIASRARAIAALAVEAGATRAMIGGAPYLMGSLAATLKIRGITPLYSFTRRESVEETLPDGSVRKMAVFRHVGWVGA